jgi:WD40 repeat protein
MPPAYKKLWFWGAMCIVAGTVGAGISQSLFAENRPTNRAEAAGMAFAQVFMIAVGLVLLVIHFSRRLRQGAGEEPSSRRVEVSCPRCDRRMRVERSDVGARVRCECCETRFVAREEDEDAEEKRPRRRSGTFIRTDCPSAAQSSSETTRPRRRASWEEDEQEQGGSKTGMLVGLIASSGALVLALVGLVWLAIRGLGDEKPSNPTPVVSNPVVPRNNLPAAGPPVVVPPVAQRPVNPPPAAAPAALAPDLVLTADETPLERLAISPDGKTLVSASSQSLRLWSAENLNEMPRAAFKMLPPLTPVSVPAFAPDGRTFVVGSRTPLVYLRDSTTGAEKDRISLPAEQRPPGQLPYIEAVAFAPDGQTLLVGMQTFEQKRGLPLNLYVCDVGGLRVARKLNGHIGGVRALAYSPGGDTFISAGADGILRIWDPRTYREQKSVGFGSRGVLALAFSADGRWLAVAGEDGKVRICTAQDHSYRVQGTLPLGTVYDLRFSANSKLLATAGADGSARLWDTETLQERAVLRSQGNVPVRAVVFGKGDAVLFAACGKTIQRWDVKALAAR